MSAEKMVIVTITTIIKESDNLVKKNIIIITILKT